MASKIRVLDEVTINQIAAGEVIENASSVIKELVDNCLDAGATKIVVEVQGSGRTSIVVQDDGCGMSYDDLQICLERHATSKISSQEDLWRIATMGFRGEALSSIASIAHISILTAQSGGSSIDSGHHLVAAGGKISSCMPTKTLVGTKITVEDLFYNVPARRKFLRSPSQEAKEILKVVILHALVRHDVAFDLMCNEKKELALPSQGRAERIKALLGAELFSQLVPLSFKNESISMSGYVGKPTASRPTRTQQYLFVNGRAVVSPFISAVVKDAYGSSIEATRHPAFILYIDLAPDCLDVNVHPQKKQVRFSQEEEIKRCLIKAVSEALFFRAPAVHNIIPGHVSDDESSQGASHESTSMRLGRSEQYQWAPSSISSPKNSSYARSFETRRIDYEFLDCDDKITPRMESFQTEPLLDTPTLGIVGIYDEYILASGACEILPGELTKHGLVFIHSRYALSRILFEESSKKEQNSSSQALLVPLFIECSQEESAGLKIALPLLEKEGLSIREFGKDGFLVEAVPSFLDGIDLEEFVRHVAVSIDHKVVIEKQRDVIFRDAFKLHKRISGLGTDMAQNIVKRLFLCGEPFVCPFGNKIIFVLTDEELKKRL